MFIDMDFAKQFTKYDLNLHGVRLPVINIDNELKTNLGLDKNADNKQVLRVLCYEGFKEKLLKKQIDPKDAEIYTKKCDEEVKIFEKLGIVDYILLVYDILSWCDKNNIARGVGRGSAGGSLVLYLIGITSINPVKHNFYFPRFISEARFQSKIIDGVTYFFGPSLCDIDCDVSYENRKRLLSHINDKFQGKVSKIGSQITLSGKLALKEAAKANLGVSEEEAMVLSRMVERHFGTVELLSESLKNNKDLKAWYEASPKNHETFELAQKIELLVKARGVHASGVAISFDNISESLPLELSSGQDEKEVVTSYNMEDIANLVVKCDFLGLKNADVNFNICKHLGIDISSIDVNHPSIYEFLQNSECFYGLFQIECGLTKEVVKKVKPKNIDHLAACLAISRPGSYKYIDQYVDFVKNGEIQSFHPLIDRALKNTGSIIIYQENINAICQELYGLSPVEAENVSYCVRKKKKDKMKEWEPIFIQKGKEKGISEEVTQKFWDICNASADYLFCEIHSYEYCYMTAINTYLKANYTKEFYFYLLKMAKNESNFTEVLSDIYSELGSVGVKLLPPNIVKSGIDFTLEDDGIRFGLSAIKGISDKAIEKLNNFREKNKSDKFSTFQAANDAKLPVNILSSLILVGSLDHQLTQTRARTFMELCLWNLLKPKEKDWAKKLAIEYNYDLITIVKVLNEKLKNEKGQPIIKDTRRATIKKHFSPFLKIYEYNKKNEKLCAWKCESELLGFSYSTNLYEIFSPVVEDLYTIFTIGGFAEGTEVRVVGEVIEVKHGKSKEKKTPYFKMDIKDHTGVMRVMMFDTERQNSIEECKLNNNNKLPDIQDVVIVRGVKRDGNCLFAKSVGIQEINIFSRISQLPIPQEE